MLTSMLQEVQVKILQLEISLGTLISQWLLLQNSMVILTFGLCRISSKKINKRLNNKKKLKRKKLKSRKMKKKGWAKEFRFEEVTAELIRFLLACWWTWWTNKRMKKMKRSHSLNRVHSQKLILTQMTKKNFMMKEMMKPSKWFNPLLSRRTKVNPTHKTTKIRTKKTLKWKINKLNEK